MTNKEWLEYLANNAPDELAAWFDAEHVETANGTLDGDTAALNAKIAELERKLRISWEYECKFQAERDTLQGALDIAVQNESKLEAERDKLKELNGYHAAQYELASEDCDRLQAQVDELTQIAESKRVSFADRIRFVNEIDELKAERDNLKANNEQLHMLAGEQAAKIDELQAAFGAICANLSIIADGEPGVIADIAIATIEALIDECNTANRQCNEYRSKFGKCLDYADAIHALMDEGMA